MLSCEILLTAGTSRRGRKMLLSMEQNAPTDVALTVTHSYEGKADWLMMFGYGGDDRWPHYIAHREAGKRAILFDLGYWDREESLRVSVDDQHPHRWLYRMPIIEGRGHPAQLRDDFDASGPILFACMGRKSRRHLGEFWDDECVANLRRATNRPVIVRVKPDRKIVHATWPPIEQALRGCSRVVSHHSNVAIDGIIAGIPHDVADGAALALDPTRDPVKRREFLDRLGSWQWRAVEAAQIWRFLRSVPEK